MEIKLSKNFKVISIIIIIIYYYWMGYIYNFSFRFYTEYMCIRK